MKSAVTFLTLCLLACAPIASWANLANVRVSGDRLTVKAESTPLVDLLREIARKAGIAMVLRGQTGQIVTVEFVDAPIDEVLQSLLRQNPGLALAYDGEPGKRRLVKAYVVLHGNGAAVEEVINSAAKPNAVVTATEMTHDVAEEKLREGSPEEFAQALTTIYSKYKPGEALYAALRHPDASVRSNAVTMLAEIGSGPRAKQALEDAANDTDVTVRSIARRLLGRKD